MRRKKDDLVSGPSNRVDSGAIYPEEYRLGEELFFVFNSEGTARRCASTMLTERTISHSGGYRVGSQYTNTQPGVTNSGDA